MIDYPGQAVTVLAETEIDAVLIALIVFTIALTISSFRYIKKTL